MRAIDVSQIKSGIAMPTALLHQSGVCLLRKGEKITPAIQKLFAENGIGRLYLLDKSESPSEMRQRMMLMPVMTENLVGGQIITTSIHDASGKLLLEAGTPIPENFKEKLANRGIERLFTRRPEEEINSHQGMALRRAIEDMGFGGSDSIRRYSKKLDKVNLRIVDRKDVTEDKVASSIDSGKSLEILPEGDALEKELKLSDRMVMQSEEDKEAFLNVYEEAMTGVYNLYQAIQKETRVDGTVVREVAQTTVGALMQNRELLMAAGNMSLPGNYLVSHSLAVTIVAINIGVTMGFSKSQVLSLGYGALLHDVGMLKIPRELMDKPSELNEREWQMIRRHPAFGLDMLQRIIGIPVEVPYVVYQTHERLNGSGYPRAKKETFIHTYARVVAVADVYNSVCSDRPYRKAMAPYQAMEQLVLMCGKKQIDSNVVRAFLRCNSMFPIGSWVRLSNGNVGRVVAAVEEDYMNPVVSEMFDPQNIPLPDPKRINLAETPDLSVKDIIPNEQLGQFHIMEGF